MAASAWIVPGPDSGPTEALASPAFDVTALPSVGSCARIAWALLPAPFVGFALGVALALAQAPPSAMPKARIGAPPPVPVLPAAELRPRLTKPTFGKPAFWKPAGSTAVRPSMRLSVRHYHPPVRLAGRSTLDR